jgi:hypothetical protein
MVQHSDRSRDAGIQRTATAATDFTLGAGWGSTRSATLLAGSSDRAGVLTITASGSSYAQATATVVFTFADGAYPVAPVSFVQVTDDSSIDEGHVVQTNTTTASTWTFSVLPVSTKIYIFRYFFVVP